MGQAHYRYDLAQLTADTGRDGRWMKRALILASTSQHTRRMGAIAVMSGRILAEATNRRRNPPSSVSWWDCSFHAEESLVRQRPDLHGATVYVARLNASSEPAMARPCTKCHDRLVRAGVRRTVWTASVSGDLGVETYIRA